MEQNLSPCQTPLHSAIEIDKVEIAQFLNKNGANLGIRSPFSIKISMWKLHRDNKSAKILMEKLANLQ